MQSLRRPFNISLCAYLSLSFICLPIKPGGMALRAAVGASSMLSFVVVLVKQMGPGAQREREEKKKEKKRETTETVAAIFIGMTQLSAFFQLTVSDKLVILFFLTKTFPIKATTFK